MNRTFWITLIVSAAAGLFVVVGQVGKTRILAQQLADEQAKATPESDRKPEAPDPPEREPSKEKIERALARVIGLQPDVTKISPVLAKENLDPEDQLKIDYSGIESEYTKVFPDFLRSVEGLSVDELLAVAGKIPDSKSGNPLLKPRTKNWLLLLAAERDPLRVYRDETLMEDTSKRGLLDILGRADPAAALQLLPPMEKQTGEPNSDGTHRAEMLVDWALPARIRASTRLLGVDLEGGLLALSEIHDNYGYIPAGCFGTLGNTPVPKEAIPGLIDAMGRPGYAEMRDDFIEMVLRDTVFDGGVEVAAARLEEMELTEGELNTAIDEMINNDIMEGEPEAMIDWMSELRPGKVPSLVATWAETDMKAAADWMIGQESSPMRDQALARFASKTSKLDPAAAVAWANEIQNDKLRNDTLRQLENR